MNQKTRKIQEKKLCANISNAPYNFSDKPSIKSTDKPSKLRQRAEEHLYKNKQKENQPKTIVETMHLLHELQVHQIELELQNQELEESRAAVELALAHFTDLYDSAIAGYFTFDRNGMILQTNLLGALFLGLERSKAFGKYFTTYIMPDECDIFNELLKKVFTTQDKQSCEVTLSKDDSPFLIVQIEATIFNNGQECRAVVQDITERKQKEKLARLHQLELTQVSRVNSMGELASALAHEMNQPLAVILNYVNGCIRRLESNNYTIDEIIDVMRLTAKQVELAGNIMHHMKNIVRQDMTYYKLASINEIAEAAVSQIQKEPHYDSSVTIELQLENNLPLVNVDYIQIELVILNLLRNSIESFQKFKVDRPKLILRTNLQNDFINVSVIDNGPHYSLDEEMHLFKPCFTTKKMGMGMGLSISRTIVEAHLGYLSSNKLSVTGVCFQFTLPIYKANI